MKKIFMIVLVAILFQTTTTNAITFPGALPGGKNYLDPNNFTLTSSALFTKEAFMVKEDTDYVLTIPGDMEIGITEIYVYGDRAQYLGGITYEIDECVPGPGEVVCFFHTEIGEQYLFIEVQANDVDLYYSYYEMDGFQLEEGTVPTEYEPYIAPYADLNDPEFTGSGAYVKPYYQSIALVDIIADYVVVYDDIDGDLSDQIVITNDPYTSHMHEVGTYVVSLEATDSSNNTAEFDFTIIVKDEIAPSITGDDHIYVDVNDGLTLEQIASTYYTAFDEYDGNLTLTFTNDQYTSNKDILGSYTVTLVATDSSGNIDTKDITITVEDYDAPGILSSTHVTVTLSNIPSLNTILLGMELYDNYSSADMISIMIITDDYTANQTTLGSYIVTVRLVDEVGNYEDYIVTITVEDDIAPVITGPTSVQTSYIDTYTTEEITALLTASDNYDNLSMSDAVITLDTYSNRSGVIGTFTIEYQLQDASGNMIQHQVLVTIVDDQAPVFYIDTNLVTVTPQAMFQPSDALNMLVANGTIPEGEYRIDVVSDDYSGHEKTPGSYEYVLLFTNRTGESFEESFTITVEDETQPQDSLFNIRNIIVYGLTITVVTFVIIKRKK